MTATADATDRSTVKKLIETVNDLKETVEQQADRIEYLEAELKVQSSNIKGAHSRISKTDSRIDEIEETQAAQPAPEDATPGDDAAKTQSQNAETPLERICALPEHIADRELTANQERARFIARDVRDYAEKAPAGLVIDSRAIKRVITASEEKRPHTQTVARVMDFLDDLGKEGVQLKKRRGKKLIVVDPDAADRLTANHDRCDGGSGPTHAETVIPSG